MNIVWFCNYSLYYLKNYIDVKVDFNRHHPTTWIHYLLNEAKEDKKNTYYIIVLSKYLDKNYKITQGNINYLLFFTGFKHLCYGLNRIVRGFDLFLNRRLFLHKISKIVKKLNPDIINIHGTEDYYGLILKYLDFPSVVWMQGFIHDVYNFDKSFFIKRQLKVEKKILNYTKNVISNHSELDNKLLRINHKLKIHHLSYPISTFAFNNFSKTKSTDVIFVGRIVKEKGVEDFIDAIRYLVIDKKLMLKAKLIGQPVSKEYFNYIREKIIKYGLQSSIDIIGFLEKHEDILIEISKARVFVLPTYVDTGPRTIAESMALNVPVVSYDIDGVLSMIENYSTGVIVQKGKILDLANGIEKLLNDKSLAKKIIKEARKKAEIEYHPKEVFKELKNIYVKILK